MGSKPGDLAVAAHTWETEAAWVVQDYFKEKRGGKRTGKGEKREGTVLKEAIFESPKASKIASVLRYLLPSLTI